MSGTCKLTRPPEMPANSNLYQYKACGLDNVWLVNGFTREMTPYGQSVRLEDEQGLLKALARSIATDKQSMDRKELLFLRKSLGLSQLNLAQLLGCSDQTVARWEKGKTEIDPAAERLIRLIVLEWLGDGREIKDALKKLAEQDERLHGRRLLHHDQIGWKQTEKQAA